MRETLHLSRPAGSGAALERAVRLLDAAHVDGSILTPDPDMLPRLVASLACGLTHPVRALLRSAAAEWDAASTRLPPTAVLPVAVARYTAWTGDLGTAAALWPAVHSAMAASATSTTESDAIATAAAFAGIERTATDMGDPQLAARLHTRARATRAELPTALSGRGRRLATALGLIDPATVPPDPPPGDGVGGAADLVLHLAHEILGLQPDATRHRLWLRPRLPEGAEGIAAELIRVGEDSVSMAMDLEPGSVRLRVEQDAGAIPLTVVVELFLPGRPRLARVDGVAASLAPRPEGRGTVLPVQLVLDHERTLEVEFDGDP